VTRPKSYGDVVAEILRDMVSEASDELVLNLANALNEWQDKAGRSYQNVRTQPFANKVLNAIDEALAEIEEHIR